eukprot:TRINITY_DN3239_c3_g1_i1.p1 TRINITY_DN3239_c3_g1~~TRINITY_DN3239_c3_g1_i1.p1  ORF type:complete len:1865 (+),score=643.95 TRINITY_DN3239_c3_g1_i1:74-5596(+)
MPPRSEPRRAKGVAGPASSAKVAALVGGAGADPFAAFAAFGGTAAGATATASQADTEVAQALQRLSKRDALTKQKAAADLEQLLTARPDEAVAEALPEVVGGLRRHILHRDKHVRRALCRCITAIFRKGKPVKRAAVPQLPLFMPHWLVLRCDREQEVQQAAEEAWGAAFDSEARAGSAVGLCLGPTVDALAGKVDITTEEVCADEGLGAEDARAVVDNVASGALLAFGAVCRLAAGLEKAAAGADGAAPAGSDKGRAALAAGWRAGVDEALLDSGRLWGVLQGPRARKQPAVRAAAYQLVGTLLQNCPGLFSSHQEGLRDVMLQCFTEEAEETHHAVWPACLLWLREFPDAAADAPAEAHAALLTPLYGMLRRTSGVRGGPSTYASLLPFLRLLPPPIAEGGDPSGVRACTFVDALLVSMWEGLHSESLPLTGVPDLLRAWGECWWWLLLRTSGTVPAPSVPLAEAALVCVHAKHLVWQFLCSDDLRLPPEKFAELIAPPLRRLACCTRLRPAALRLWKDVFEILSRPGQAPERFTPPAELVPCAVAAPAGAAPPKGVQKKKKGGAPMAAVSTSYGTSWPTPPAADTLPRLRLLVAALRAADTASDTPPDPEFDREFAVLFGTHLVEVLAQSERPAPSADARRGSGSGVRFSDLPAAGRPAGAAEVAGAWALCRWELCGDLLPSAYRSVLAPALKPLLLAPGAVEDRAENLLQLSMPLLLSRRSELAGLLGEVVAAGRAPALTALASALAAAPAAEGSEAEGAAAAQEAVAAACGACAERCGAADGAPWAEALAALLRLPPSLLGADVAPRACATLASALGGTRPLPGLGEAEALRVCGAVAGAVGGCRECCAPALAAALRCALLRGGSGARSAACAALLRQWAAAAQGVPGLDGPCRAAVAEAWRAGGGVDAGALAAALALPGAGGAAPQLAAELPELWAAAAPSVTPLQGLPCASQLRGEQALPPLAAVRSEPLQRWARCAHAAAAALAASGGGGQEEADGERAAEAGAHLALLALLQAAPEQVLPADTAELPKAGPLLSRPAAAAAAARRSVAALRGAESGAQRFAAAWLLRELCGAPCGRAAAVAAALPSPEEESADPLLLACLEAAAGAGAEGEGAGAACAAAASEWAAAVAERDEVGGGVADGEAVAALLVAGWCAAAEAAEALRACAWEKAQEPPPVDAPAGLPAGEALRQRLALIGALARSPPEAGIATAAELAQAAAALANSYSPSQPFAWTPSPGAPPLPLAPPVCAAALGRVLCLLSAQGAAPGVRAQLASCALDCAVALSDAAADTPPEWQEAAAKGAEAIGAALLGLHVADEPLLSPLWGPALQHRWHGAARRVLALPLGAREQLADSLDASEGDPDPDSPAAAPEQELTLRTADEVLVGLAVRFGRIVTDQQPPAAEGAAAAPGSGDGKARALPGVVTAHLAMLRALGDDFARHGVLKRKGKGQGPTVRHLCNLWELLSRDTVLPEVHCLLAGWAVLLDWLDREMQASAARRAGAPATTTVGDDMEVSAAAVQKIREGGSVGLLPVLMEIIGALLCAPREGVLRRLGTSQPPSAYGGALRGRLISLRRGLPPDPERLLAYLYDCRSGADAALGAAAVLWRLLGCIPAGPRRWQGECEASLRDVVLGFVQEHLSPSLIGRELAIVRERGGGDSFPLSSEVSVRVASGQPGVVISYDYNDAVVTVRLVLPPSFPLAPIQLSSSIEAQLRKSGVKEDVWRKWLMQMTVSLLNKSTGLWGCAVLWWQNLERHFAGQEPCPICYQVVHPATSQLPSMGCQCCSGKFHKLCLYKWFKKSSNSTCPLCRSPWYSGAGGAARGYSYDVDDTDD